MKPVYSTSLSSCARLDKRNRASRWRSLCFNSNIGNPARFFRLKRFVRAVRAHEKRRPPDERNP